MKCIFCLENKEPSDEHVFPDAIGGRLIISDVCSECNKKLGHNVDNHLTNTYFIQAKKALLGIKNKDDKFPDIFGTNKINNQEHIKIKAEIDDFGKPLKISVLPGRKVQIIGNKKVINFHSDQSDENGLFVMMNKTLMRNNLKPLSKEQFYKNLKSNKIKNPEVNLKFSTEFDKISKALVKISYEAAYLLWGQILFDDKHYNSIRKWLLSRNKFDSSEIGKQWLMIDLYQDQMKFIFDKDDYHVILFDKSSNNELVCIIRIFDVFFGKVRLTNQFSKLGQLENNLIINETLNGDIKITNFHTELLNGTALINYN